MKRVFVVGAPRSGTTLLQATVAQSFRFYSMRETHFYARVASSDSWHIKGLFIGRAGIDRVLSQIVKENELPNHVRPNYNVLSNRYSIGGYLCEFLDQCAAGSGYDAWVEKSPEHVFWVKEVAKSQTGVKFLHVIRPLEDVVASIVDAARRYGGNWAPYITIDSALELACRSLSASLKFEGEEDHLFVSYEALVSSPAKEIERMSCFIGVSALCEHEVSSSDDTFVRRDEHWKREARSGCRKFESIFSTDEQDYIESACVFLNRKARSVLEVQNCNV